MIFIILIVIYVNNRSIHWFGRIQDSPLLEYEFNEFYKQASSESKIANCRDFAYMDCQLTSHVTSNVTQMPLGTGIAINVTT